jgi:hypothetical protein
VIAQDARDEREQKRKERRPVEIDVGVGAQRKVILYGNEVSMESAELVEGVGHGHATGAGPTLIVAIEAEMEKAGVEDDDRENGNCEPEGGWLEEARLGGSERSA